MSLKPGTDSRRACHCRHSASCTHRCRFYAISVAGVGCASSRKARCRATTHGSARHARRRTRTTAHRAPAQNLRPTRDQGIPRPAHQINLRTLAHSPDCRASTRGRLRSFCGPFWRPLRSVCGLQTNEQQRTRSPDVQRFRGYSRVFAAVRASLSQSGRTVQVGFLMRFLEALQTSCKRHTAARPAPRPLPTRCMPCLTCVCCPARQRRQPGTLTPPQFNPR